MTHRMPEDHACTFDYVADAKQHLEKQNPKVVGAKMTHI